jgi:hypothetical protein
MSGSEILSEEEKQEMLRDGKDAERGKTFWAARLKSHEGGLDEYIDFLSENTDLIETTPARRVISNYRL